MEEKEKVEGKKRTDSIKQPINGQILLLSRLNVLDPQIVEKVAVALTFGRDRVPEDCLQ
jgi:hypothetical protein